MTLEVTSGQYPYEISWILGNTLVGGAPYGPAELWVDDGALQAGACPTPAPSTTPAPTTPTSSPTDFLSPLPTPSPTLTTVYTVAPDTLQLSATKPESPIAKMYLVNLNEDALSGTIQLRNASRLLKSACSIIPGNFTVGAGQLVPIDVVFSTAGLAPNRYDLVFEVIAQIPNSLPVSQNCPAMLTIDAKAVASLTQVSVVGVPTIDGEWDGISIFPYDSDGLEILTDNSEDFTVSLQSPGGVTASCAVTWMLGLQYHGACTIPAISEAGDWNLAISLDGVPFFSKVVPMNCRKGDYEDSRDDQCYMCPDGTTCEVAGIALETLPIKAGHWRSGTASSEVRECKYGSIACPGSINASRCDKQKGDDPVVSDESNYCACGYVGPMCSTCAPAHFLTWAGSEHECAACSASGGWVPTVIIGVIVVAFLALVAGLCIKTGIKAKLLSCWKIGKTKGMTLVQLSQVWFIASLPRD